MKKKIIVVEDDAKTATALSLRLKTAGYEVLVANDGNEGLILAKNYPPDLIVTDIHMAVGMGFALAFRLREFAPNLPILFVTGTRCAGVLETVENFGFAQLIEKPYNPQQFLKTVEEMLATAQPTPRNSLDENPFDAAGLPRQMAEGKGGDSLPSPSFHRARPVMDRKAVQKKILLVEDDRKIGMSLSLRLNSAGYAVTHALDALLGVSMAVKDPPHLLILDISMPAGDGFQVAERVRNLVGANVPIIFLTASKQPAFRAKAQQMGATAFFEKPYKSHELLAAIEAAFAE